MAKVASEKKYNTFVKGLITEANALTFPENASLDEDNFDLNIDGSRFRRLGIDFEDGYALVPTGIVQATLTGTRKSFHRWDFPGGASDIAIGVIRAYNKLWFVDILSNSPSANLVNGGNPITISGLANAEMQSAVINNLFVLVSEDLTYPIVLTYDKDTGLVEQSVLPILVRDVWGVVDGLGTQERPATLSERHHYNLVNQGWRDTISSICAPGLIETGQTTTVWEVDSTGEGHWVEVPVTVPGPIPTALECTKANLGVYPSNSDIWSLGKVGASSSPNFEKYDPSSMARNSIDNTEAPKGAFILDALKRGHSRYTGTGLTGLKLDEENGRFTTIATYAGRVWYSGITSNITDKDMRSPNYSGYLFFSQLVTGRDKLGKCYQEADPTSEAISDIVDTDGGTIQLPEITKVVKLVPVKDSLLIFAENGIWEIYGDTGGFKATAFQVSKISTLGITNGKSIVTAGSVVIYWAKAGIFIAAPNPQTGRYETQNISLSTIQTYYNSISDVARNNAKGFFDERGNHIVWMYNDTADYSETNNVNHYNRILSFDISLQAFYKYSISQSGTTSPMIADFVNIPSYAISSNTENVYVGNDQVLSNLDEVQINSTLLVNRVSKYSFLTFVGTSFTISKFKNLKFIDWELHDTVGVDFSSYLITGYETFSDLMRAKQVPYIWFYFKRTEDGFELDANGNITPMHQSGCLVQSQWNWSNSDAQGKWGQPFQAYRYLRNYVPSGLSDTYDTGDSIIVTKNKLRGSGKALSMKLLSETGKDMKLYGWALLVTGDGTP